MTPSELKAAVRGGKPVYGTLVVSPSPRFPEAAARMGFDFVFIDTEHIALDRETVAWMCQTYRGLGLPPLVRIPSPDPYQACMVLDAGASGVIAPYVESAAEARALAGAVHYRPLKGRRLERMLAGTETLEPELDAYLRRHNAANLLLLNIESRPGIEALDEIGAVPGVDGYLIGPHDLSCSLGVPEQYDAPVFRDAVRTIFAHARARGLGAGIHAWFGVERAAEFAREGANVIVHEADLIMFRDHAIADVAKLRRLLGDSRAADPGAAPNV